VRCVRCQQVWHAAPSRAESLLAAAEDLGPLPVAAEDVEQVAAELRAAESAAAPSGPGSWYEPPAKDSPVASGDQAADDAEGDTFVVDGDEAAEVEAPPIAPDHPDDVEPAIDISAEDFVEHRAELPADVESAAALKERRGAKKPRVLWPLTRLQSIILVLFLIDVVLVGWRSAVVRALPQTASFYALMGLPVNLRGLDFDGVKTGTEEHEGVQILVVEGNIVNDTRKSVEVPRIKFVVRNAERQEIYSWTAVPARRLLPAGEAVAFHSRLASPPPETHDVVVRFVNRRDMMAPAR
jgi:hypothetical protein